MNLLTQICLLLSRGRTIKPRWSRLLSMNVLFLGWRGCLLSWLAAAAMHTTSSSLAFEFEAEGTVDQLITTPRRGTYGASASFKVFVSGCGWLIETMETNEVGAITKREVGSTNGIEIFECDHPVSVIDHSEESTNGVDVVAPKFTKSAAPVFAVVIPGPVPVAETDSAVVGHLWLMFASGCYWPDLHTNQLIPVYDWEASAAVHGQNRRVRAGWSLLGGAGTLPKEVWYLGDYGETNGLYRATGSRTTGGSPVPTGFIFERFQVGPLKEESFVHEMVVVKRVEVAVTAIRSGCSRASLIPSPDTRAVLIDRRFDSGVPKRPPSYQLPAGRGWPTVAESKELAKVQQTADLHNLAAAGLTSEPAQVRPHDYRPIVLVVICIALLVPLVTYGIRHRRGRS